MRGRRPWRLIAALLLALPLVSLASCSGSSDEAASKQLPAVTLDSLDGGEPVDLSTLRGPMVVNLWAAWCGPCRQEMPIYARFAEKYAGRVDVLGIDWNDPQRANAVSLAEESGVTYPLLEDPDTTIDGQGPFPAHIRGLPMILLVDEQGRVAHMEYVEIKSLDQLVTLVNDNLGTAL